MAYEAVPIDVELQKVTSLERDALSRYKIHENINTFLANENVPVVIGGFIAGFLGVRLAEDIIEDLESRVGKVSDNIKDGITESVNKLNPLKKAREILGIKTMEELIAELSGKSEAEILSEVERKLGIR